MSLSGFDRKRSDRFAEFVDSSTGPRTHRRTNVDDEVVPLAQLSRRLSAVATSVDGGAPEPEFTGALRSFLVATAQRDGVGSTASAKTRTAAATAIDTAAWQAIRANDAALAGKTQVVRQVRERGTGRARLAILVGVAAGAIVLSGVSAASTGALPGDPLYTVKRSTERAQLALAGSDASRGKLYLEFARGRLDEAARVDASMLTTVLADMNVETEQGVALLVNAALASHDPSALNTVTTFVGQQGVALDHLTSKVGAAATKKSQELLNEILGRLSAIRRAMTTDCDIPTADHLGPKPAPNC